MQLGSKLHGFTVRRVRELAELQATLWELEHDKTGAELIWLDRAEENAAFAIAFKTLPENSTGVFHILEHSVLCGSDKYPVKEPFVELLKSSVQTFLNAFTFPDKTVYPFSTRNPKDYLNLMDIYLDAVFHPSIYHKPEIFRQEGWRYEQNQDQTVYQGVVLNEMKGAFSAPQETLEDSLNAMLFPDNCYRFVSGGDPACIPDLSYEAFLAAHRKYYHPSNARIALVGNLELDAVLAKLNSFLQSYDRMESVASIPLQRPVEAVKRTVPYEIGAEEPLEHRTIVSAARLLCRFDERERLFAASVLADYLAGDNDAPLKKAVVSNGLGQDLNVSIHDGLQQSWISCDVWNTDEESVPELQRIIRETLAPLAENGLDPQRLRACFNAFAFQVRDRDSGWMPRSLSEAMSALDTWLYGGDPAQGLTAEQTLSELSEKLEGDYFRNLLRELFLDDSHSATVILTPSHTLGAEKAEREAQRIAQETANWTEEARAKLQQDAERLQQWQQTPDSPEAIATIPVLHLSELKTRPEPISVEVGKQGDIPVLYHNTGNRLSLFKTIFNVSDLSLEELPRLVCLTMLLGTAGTRRHSAEQIQMLVKERIGRLRIMPNILPGDDPEHCRVQLIAAVTCLPEQADVAAELLEEILLESSFSDRRLLRDLLQQSAMNAQMALSANGNQYAMLRVSAYHTAHGVAKEYTSGTELALWFKRWSAAGDDELDGLLQELSALAKRCVTAGRLTLTFSEHVPMSVRRCLSGAFPASGNAPAEEAAYLPLGKRQEGIEIPAQVGYCSRGENLKHFGMRFRGSLPVLANVLNYVYLWSEIRVQGGAYGCGFYGRNDGDIGYYTYRDPMPGRSLEIMGRSAEFLRGFCAEKPDMTGYILGAVNSLDPYLPAEERCTFAENNYFRGITDEELCRRYTELLHTTPEDLLSWCPALDAIAAQPTACVIAGADLLTACGDAITSRLRI